MNQEPTFSYATRNITLGLCTLGAMSGAMSTIFAFNTLLNPDVHNFKFCYAGSLALVISTPLLAATFQKCKEQDTNGKQSIDVSKGWFSLAIAASSTAIANSIYYCATQVISNEIAIATSTLSGIVITACAMRMYMDRIRQPLSNSIA